MADRSEKVTPSPLIQPLPWSVREDADGLASVIDSNGFAVLIGVTVDEAALIVRAVNCHDELVRMLRFVCGARGLGRMALIDEARELLKKVDGVS